MKTWKLVAVVTTFVLSASVNAALIDNGAYTTDDVNNLDWLDLDYTEGLSYNAAQFAAASVAGGAWTYASEGQVNDMFFQMFPGWLRTHSQGTSFNTLYSSEVDLFTSLFGHSDRVGINDTTRFSRGFYLDDVGILRMLGVNNAVDPVLSDLIFGPDLVNDFTDWNMDNGTYPVSTFLVRSTAVPVPAAVWLFGSGLIGLAGFARRKQA